MSFTDSVLFLFFLLLSPLLRRCFSAAWHRAALCVLLAFFALPVGMLAQPAIDAVFTRQIALPPPYLYGVPAPPAATLPQTAGELLTPAAMPQNLPMLLAALWLGVAAVLLIRKAASLKKFRRLLKHSLSPVTDGQMLLVYRRELERLGIQEQVALYKSPCVGTPMIVGLGRAAVVLPEIAWAQEELALVLRHELTHWRHRDLWVKWAGGLLCALHWFNPCIWLLTRRLDRWMELACDAAVVRNMDLGQRREYGNTILSVLGRAQPEAGQGICAAFCEDRQNMKERLAAMLGARQSTKIIRLLSIAVLAGFCLGGMLVAGVTYKPGAELPSGGPQPDAGLLAEGQPTGDEPNSVTHLVLLEEGDTISLIWPVDGGRNSGGIGSYYGHTGLDISAPQGTSIWAAHGGIVTYASNTVVWPNGRSVVIDHGGGFFTRYAHCSEVLVAAGDEVSAEQLIAKIGRTGNATGNHLHFELRYYDEVLDPELYISRVS